MTEKQFHYGIDHLTVEIVMELCSAERRGVLTQQAIDQVNVSRSRVEKMVAAELPVYGINTGFGPLCDTQISAAETSKLQENLLITHAVGVGQPITPQLSKMMLICKIHALCQGYSGIRLSVIERMMHMVDHDILPVVPEQGSVGASGDLAPLSHLFLPLIGEGEIWHGDDQRPARDMLASHGLEPIVLAAKEGLALINGTQFIAAHAVLGLHRMQYLLDLADVSGAMALEGFQGSSSPFRVELHEVRPFDGTKRVARRIRTMLEASQNMASHANCGRVQDPYSIRCMPQVHGAARNAIDHLQQLTEIELNSVTDNPIIISDTEAISGGNFHGQPLAMALDYATIAAAEIGNITDRRCYLLLEGKYGLPRLLTEHGGLNSGFMIPQYTTAALVTENKVLCYPASADSIPTSLGQEDHVSMGSISGRKFNLVITNLEKIIAIELMYATQAMDFRRPNTFSEIIEQNYAIIRDTVAKLEDDRLLKDDIDNMIRLVRGRALEVEV